MALSAGTRLGAYEILSTLGAGGMGEVYRARDTRLGRDVALKLLPEHLARDPERIARFRREAQVLAALNHQNIGAIYGLEEAGDPGCLVLEFVEGETLRERIARGSLPPAEALPIATQIAEALQAAHEKGVIHRDLKPANIVLTSDGRVKVLDFGLAKAVDPTPGASSDLASSPTLTSPALATGAGVILGTAAYMSPEQAKGHAADKRSDIWGFGCVLFEMLTATRAFPGADVSDTLAAVLRSEPDWTVWPSTAPTAVRALVEGTLKKDRRERIADISTALFVLKQLPPSTTPPPAPRPPARRLWTQSLLLVGAAMVGAALAGSVWRAAPQPPASPVRFAVALPDGSSLTLPRQAVAISPDGSTLAYVAGGQLYFRSMSEFEPKAIPGTEGAISPVFSPDGAWLAFWADSMLKKAAVSGGSAIVIGRAIITPMGMTWDADGLLLAEPGIGILRVSPAGGEPQVQVPESGELLHGPQRLPDGSTLLFTVAQRSVAEGERWDRARIVVQSLTTGMRTTLIDGGTNARYVPTGHLVYMSAGILFAAPFDLSSLRVTSAAVPLIEGVRRAADVMGGGADFAFSDSGSLVYVPGPTSGSQQVLALFDRKGNAQALNLPLGSYRYPRVSPDGRRLLFETSEGREDAISIFELSGTSAARRLTFGGNNRFPVWSSDGRRVTFQSDREGDLAVFWQPAEGGPAERLTTPEAGTAHVPEAWSPTGDTLLFNVVKGSETSLWMFSLRNREARPFGNVRSTRLPTNAVFSPDGRWVAYQVGESGREEATTFVQPFPPNGVTHQIARGGRPLWSLDGTELFYVPAPGQFMVVTVRTQPSFSFTNPVPVPRGFGTAMPSRPRPFDILPDGRFVGVGVAGPNQGGPPTHTAVRIVLNWFDELRQRVPAK